MSIDAEATVRALPSRFPQIPESAYIAAGARVIGDVALGEYSSVWYNAVLRGDSARITVGARSNVQDGATIHVDVEHLAVVGNGVSIGHNAVVHGCTIGDDTLIGMGAVVLNGAKVGAQCLIAGGAVVLSGTLMPDGFLVAGVPATPRRPLTVAEREGLMRNAEVYLDLTRIHSNSAPVE